MDLYNRYTHIEDVLIPLNPGQWFTWSDTKNKCYETLVVIDGKYPKPSKESLETELERLQAAEPIRLLRIDRNEKLAESDWMAFKDVTLTTAWKTYRQALRDITAGLDTVDKVNAVTWPTKPE